MSTEDTKEDKSSIFLLKSGEKLHCNKLGAMSLSVTDTGAGMSPDQLSRLFRAGVQFNVNELQAGQGSGLGLYISKGIVEQHRGSLSAVSEGLSKGSTFIMEMPLFDVPILDQEEGEKESTAPGQQLKRRESKSLLLRILVVDDADTNRKLLSRLLENRGHQCDQAANGKAAVELVRKSMEEGYYYDTILLDYEMPEMNGPQACKELRRLGCDSFVVGISGNVLPEDVSHFKSCGANAVLPKPFQFSLLEDLWIEYDVSSRNCSA